MEKIDILYRYHIKWLCVVQRTRKNMPAGRYKILLESLAGQAG